MSDVRCEQTPTGPVLENGAIRIAINLAEGTLDLTELTSERTVISGAAVSVVLEGRNSLSSRGSGFELAGESEVEDVHGPGMSIRLRRTAADAEPVLTVIVSIYENQTFALIEAAAENASVEPINIASFQVLDSGTIELGSPAQDWRFYKHGWQSWSPTLVLACSGEDVLVAPPVVAPGVGPEAAGGRFSSDLMTAVVDPLTNEGLVAGFISATEQFSQLQLDRDTRTLTAVSYADGIAVPAGVSLRSERLVLLPTREPLKALEDYGDASGRQMRAIPFDDVASGWCSWYCYWHGVTEQDIVGNLEELSNHRGDLPVAYVQIDDGWQADIGDWLTVNYKFPHGLEWLVDAIHEKGFRAGLWLAPFLMGANSHLYREHPDWAVRHRSGKPYIAMQNWGQDCYALDLTRPEAIAWIESVFAQICEGWGFDYVKVDFVYAGAVDGLRHDPNVTRAQAYRRGLEAIRRAFGDRFILGCGNPMGPSVGLVDGARISPDVAPFWYPAGTRDSSRNDMSTVSALNAVRNTLNRYWMHGRLWMSDPDCLLARDTETALTEHEVRSLATVIAMSGGMMLDSDALKGLSAKRRRIISMLLPVYGRAAVPLDLFQSDLPGLLRLELAASSLLAVLNWSDVESDYALDVGETPVHAFDVWEGQYLGVPTHAVQLKMPPHGCKLLSLRPALPHPQFVGSTFHLLQDGCQVREDKWDDDSLRLSLSPVACVTGDIFIASAGFGTPQAEGQTLIQLTQEAAGLWRLGLRVERPLELRLRFDHD